MGILSLDTSDEAEKFQLDILRRQGDQGRLKLLENAILTSWTLSNLGKKDRSLTSCQEAAPAEISGELQPMKPLRTPLQAALAFDTLEIPYVVGGSYASSIHGEPRSTRDCDFLADLKTEHLVTLPPLLQKEFYLSETAMEEALRLRRSFNLIHLETGFKIDIFVSEGRPFDEERLKRGISLDIGQQTLRISTAEDTILAKLEWYELHASEQQWRDILGILLIQKNKLDSGYLKFWARELLVEESLQRALAASA